MVVGGLARLVAPFIDPGVDLGLFRIASINASGQVWTGVSRGGWVLWRSSDAAVQST
jgi:hypothetical protein